MKNYLIIWAVWSGGMATSYFIDSCHIRGIWAAALGILWIFPLNAALAAIRKEA